MKLWVVMFLVMVAIFAGGTYVEHSILKTTDTLSHKLDTLQGHVEAERWQEANPLCSEIDHYWSRQKEKWSPFIHNHELDTITTSFTRIVSLLKSEEQSDVLAEIAVVKVQLVQLHHQEVLTLKNVF